MPQWCCNSDRSFRQIHTIIMKAFIKWNIDIVGNSLLTLLLWLL